MRQLKIRIAGPQDSAECLRLLESTPNNSFDSKILTYSTLTILKSYSGLDNVAYLPMHSILLLESVGKNPECSPLESAQALRDLVKGAQIIASHRGCAEIWVEATDPAVEHIALSHGFERIQNPVLKLALL